MSSVAASNNEYLVYYQRNHCTYTSIIGINGTEESYHSIFKCIKMWWLRTSMQDEWEFYNGAMTILWWNVHTMVVIWRLINIFIVDHFCYLLI